MAMKSRWMRWVLDVTRIRDENCIHSCAAESLKGRELVCLLADEWHDNIKEMGVRMWFSNRCLMHATKNALINS